MNYTKDLLTVNEYSRPGRKLNAEAGIVIHWVAKPGQSPAGVRDYWEGRKNGGAGYGSAHYIIGIKGDVLQTVPDDEVAYHCGATSTTQGSNGCQYYTDMARKRWPSYTIDFKHKSTNQIMVGIELCHPDWTGKPTPSTYASLIVLVATLCKAYGLNPMVDIFRHWEIVGYKSCPLWYVNHQEEWQALLKDMENYMEANT